MRLRNALSTGITLLISIPQVNSEAIAPYVYPIIFFAAFLLLIVLMVVLVNYCCVKDSSPKLVRRKSFSSTPTTPNSRQKATQTPPAARLAITRESVLEKDNPDSIPGTSKMYPKIPKQSVTKVDVENVGEYSPETEELRREVEETKPKLESEMLKPESGVTSVDKEAQTLPMLRCDIIAWV